MTYQKWFKEIVWLKDKVILPNGQRISKLEYVTKDGFANGEFSNLLFKTYNKLYPVIDGRRYKK